MEKAFGVKVYAIFVALLLGFVLIHDAVLEHSCLERISRPKPHGCVDIGVNVLCGKYP